MSESKCLNGSSVKEQDHNLAENKSPAAASSQLVPVTPAKSEKPWTDRQELALRLIVSGHKVKDTAAQLGVDRRTINRWMKHPRFQIVMQRTQQQVRNSLQEQLIRMVNTAFDALEHSMSKGEYQTALGLLKSLKVLDGSPLTDGEADSSTATADVNSAASDFAPEDAGLDASKMGHTGHFPAEDPDEEIEPAEPVAAQEMGHTGHSSDVKLLKKRLLDGLEAGKSMAQSFLELRLKPAILHDWLRNDAEFKAAVAAYSEWTQGYWELRSVQLGVVAAACVNNALQNGNGRVALELLRGLQVV